MELSAQVPDAEILGEASAGYAGGVCHVLEFGKNDGGDFRRAASGRGSGSLGICAVFVSGEEISVSSLYYSDDDAFSGSDAVGISSV